MNLLEKRVQNRYPSRQKYGAFPVGGRKTMTKEELPPSIDSADQLRKACRGFLQCRVTHSSLRRPIFSSQVRPPATGHVPVLPLRINGKLKFVYCHTCGAEGEQGLCTHDDDDRDLEGTWATVELELALRHGYTIVECFQVIHSKLAEIL